MLSDDELKAMATATVMFPLGFTVRAERRAERCVCDKLVADGKLARIEGVPDGYRLSDEAAAAQRVVTERRADQARRN